MTNLSIIFSLFVTFVIGVPCLAEEIAIIINPSNTIATLTSKEVSDLYMGRIRTFGTTNHIATVYEQPMNSHLRESFFRALTGAPLSQIDAYWAFLHFSGEIIPPKNLENTQQVLKMVSSNPDGIGYVEAPAVNPSVKVIFTLPNKTY